MTAVRDAGAAIRGGSMSAEYLEARKCTNFPAYRARGWPIGSGITEPAAAETAASRRTPRDDRLQDSQTAGYHPYPQVGPNWAPILGPVLKPITIRGRPEPIRSSFDANELDTWILRLLAQVKEVPCDSVVTLLANTYFGYLATRASAAWEPQMRGEAEGLLRRMLELGLLEGERGRVRLSLLGKACRKSHLKLRSAMRLVEGCRRRADGGALTAGTLLALIHTLPEFDDAYTPMIRKGHRETIWQDHVAQHYGRDGAIAL